MLMAGAKTLCSDIVSMRTCEVVRCLAKREIPDRAKNGDTSLCGTELENRAHQTGNSP
jgi:hypothetical protein